TCGGGETGALSGGRLLGLRGWAVLARLSGLWRLFGLGCVRGRTGMRLCLSTCRRCETGLLSGARLLGLRGRAVLARLSGLWRLFGLELRVLSGRRLFHKWTVGVVTLVFTLVSWVRRVSIIV